MADQTIRIDLIARAQTQAFGRVNAQLQSLGRSARHAAADTSIGLGRIGAASATAGTALLVGVGAALAVGAKAAIDFESAFAGVRKTVDASETTFSRLARGLRDLSLDIPVSVGDLTKIAELGGQLGIPANKLEAFTEVIAKLAATTNLDIEEAATSIARFANVMGTSQDDFDKLGSAIVFLGNNFATTESEILTFGQRLAGIGATVGLTEGDVLGLAAAFTALGEPAERGATAVQRTFIKMLQAVGEGGEKLEMFASVSGLTAEAFARIFQEDPVQAFIAFERGLDAIVESGGDATQILDAVGLGSQRVTTLLLKGAAANESIEEAVEGGNESLERNVALNEEAEKRFETTASQITLVGNAFRDMTIEIGQASDGFVNFGVRALREFFILMQENLEVIQAMIPFIVALASAKVLGKLGNMFFNTGIKVGASTPVLRAFAGGLNRVLMVSRILGGALGVFAIGIAVVGAAMAANRAKARQYAEGLETLVDVVEAFNSGTATATEVFEAFNDVLSQPTGVFDRVVDLEKERAFLVEMGTTAGTLVRLAVTDVGAFHRLTRGIMGDQQAIIDQIDEAAKASEEPGLYGSGKTLEDIARIDKAQITLDRFRLITDEILIATQNLREAERLRQEEADIESGLTAELAFAGVGPPVGDPFQRHLDSLGELYTQTQEEYDDFLVDLVDSTEEFGADFGEAWTETITDFTDRFFDWSAAWDEYEQVAAIGTKAFTSSIENWNKDQQRLFDTSIFIHETYGTAVGDFYDQLDEGIQRDLAATYATDPEAFFTKFNKVLTSQTLLMALEFEKFVAAAPAGASKALAAWDVFFDTEVSPKLENAGEEGSERYTSALIEGFGGFKAKLIENAPALAQDFNDFIIAALEQVDTDFTLFDIEALTRSMTTVEKLLFFTNMGIEWKTAIILAFGDLPGALGRIGAEAGRQVHNRFSSELVADSPSKVFIGIGKGVREGFRLGIGDMGEIMAVAGMDVSRSFNPVVPQSAASVVNNSNLTINHPHHPTDDLSKDLQKADVLGKFQRMAEVGSINNT